MALIQTVVDYIRGVLSPLLNNVVIAVFTFFIGLIVGRVAGKLTSRTLHSFGVDKTLKEAIGVSVSFEGLLEVGVSYVTYFIFFVVSLNQLGLTQWVLIGISGFAGLIGVIAMVLALKDVLPNAVSGLLVMARKFPQKGDRVRIDSVEGKVEELTLLETRIKTKKGDIISFPNRQLIRSKVEKLSKSK